MITSGSQALTSPSWKSLFGTAQRMFGITKGRSEWQLRGFVSISRNWKWRSWTIYGPTKMHLKGTLRKRRWPALTTTRWPAPTMTKTSHSLRGCHTRRISQNTGKVLTVRHGQLERDWAIYISPRVSYLRLCSLSNNSIQILDITCINNFNPTGEVTSAFLSSKQKDNPTKQEPNDQQTPWI
jgi:hypothetical protein